jgi:hypothetical protein
MNHIGDLAQLITAVVLALNFFQSWKNGRMLKDVKHQTDGLTKQLVKVTGDAKFEEGVKQGALDEREQAR